MKRKLFFTLIALLAAITSAQAQRVYIDGLYYNLFARTAEVTNNSSYVGGELTIPETVTYNNITYSVTSIGNFAFSNCSGLTSVTIGNSVTSIGERAFYECSNLTSVTIGNSVTSIGYGAFEDCSSLPVIDNLRYADTYLVEAVDKTLSTYNIKEGTKWIGYSAFSNCSSLTSITIPNSVTSIGSDAFWDCSSLTTINVEEGNTVYDSRDNCNAIIKTATNTLIAGCMNTIIPETVTSIGDEAFSGCRSLTSVTIPNSVTSIGDDAFFWCDNLTAVHISDIASWCAIDFDNSSANPLCNGANLYLNGELVTDLIIPESVETIQNYVFCGCSSLTSVTIPNSVTSIGSGAFYGCRYLWSVTINSNAIVSKTYTSSSNIGSIFGSQVMEYIIGDDVTGIGDYAFYKSYLTRVTIGNSVTSIGDYAFEDCEILESVTIGNSVTSIGSYAFSWCRYLGKLNLHPTTPPILGSGVFLNVGNISGLDVYVYVKCGSKSLYAEQQWGGFSSFIGSLPYSIKVESSNTNMGNVSITKQPQSCYNLTTVVEATPNYGYYFLRWSDGSTENPYSLTLDQDTLLKAEFFTIGTGSGKCGDNLYWELQDGKLFITGFGPMYDNRPFRQIADKIRSVSFPADMTTVGDYAFYGCNNLTSVLLPQNVTTIGEYAFAECTMLSDVTIGAAVTEIGCGAFYNDSRIDTFTCYAPEPPTVCDNTFYNVSQYAYLYVPSDVLRKYQLAPSWRDFDIQPIGATSVTPSDNVTVVPSERDAQFTWPANGNASSYTLQITKNNEVFCTLVFNEYGQLTGIAFAPARNGEQHPRQAATATTNGWQFTVTGLNEGSAYAYTLDVKDAANQVLNSYNGTFRTEGGNDDEDDDNKGNGGNDGEEPASWTLSVSSNNAEWGSVTGAGTYEDGTEVVIEAIPAMGYRFLYWNDNNTTNPRTVIMTEDATYTAYFDRITQGTNDLSSDSFAHPCKVIENGTIYILLPDGRKLTLQGAEVR